MHSVHLPFQCSSVSFTWPKKIRIILINFRFQIGNDGQSKRLLANLGRILFFSFLAHLAFRPGELLSSLFVRRLSSVVRPSTFHILIFSSETTGPIATKLWWNGPWTAPFQNCVRWSRLPTKVAAKLKIEKRGDEILIVHCCFSVSQNELKF